MICLTCKVQDYNVRLVGLQAISLVEDIAELGGCMAVLIDCISAILCSRNKRI